MRNGLLALVVFCSTALPSPALAQEEALFLGINGRVNNGEEKLEGCAVLVFKGNELVGQQLTGRNGRFGLELGLGETFALEFKKEGFLPKRVVVDTGGDLPKDLMEIVPIEMTMSMLPATKYAGADTDELDFPFAIIRFDRRAGAFVQDQQYTADMMRTNGALLLMSGRAGKQ